MAHRDSFSGYHPVVNLVYFVLVLVFTMFLLHPLMVGASLLCALAYAAQLKGWREAGHSAAVLLPVMGLAAVLNPAFNHRGVTILAYFPTGNPLTLESILYGLAAAGMLGAVLLWFSCCAGVLTTDKFVWLFGRAAPALSLVLSMTLGLIPRLRQRLKTIREGQRTLGLDISQGSTLQRVRNAVTILSILVTWSLESAVETADSMKSRGYGLPGRTAFSIYRFERRDVLSLVWLLACGCWLAYGWVSGGLNWYYYPALGGAGSGAYVPVWLALCLTPVYLQRREARQWKRLRSGI